MKQFIFWLQLQFSIDDVFLYLQKTWHFFNDYHYLRTMILVISSFFVARLVSKYIPLLISKITQHIKFNLGEKIALLLRPLLFRVVFLLAIGLIVSAYQLSATLHFVAIGIVKSLIIIFTLLFFDKLIGLILQHLSTNNDAKKPTIILPATVPIFEYTAIIFLILIGIYLVFGVWHIEMTALLASAGIMGLAVSMAAKDTLSDVIAGILILTDAPFQLGDVIKAGGETGTITQIGIRSTRIRTKENIEIVVPNGKIGSSEIINQSANLKEKLKIKLIIKAAYGVDPDMIRNILIGIAKNTDYVLKDESMKVVLSDFNQEYITFVLSCLITQGELQKDVLPEMREKVYLQFLKHNIAAALPEKQAIEITDFPYIFGNGQPRKITHLNATRKI